MEQPEEKSANKRLEETRQEQVLRNPTIPTASLGCNFKKMTELVLKQRFGLQNEEIGALAGEAQKGR